ncbi:hypothetical protein [Alteromonas oceanisediminis]|uniref:hypothetical protein n=1 Tax=Alteromonas oceanisediminis TaxID=2836180 RepID=UPI001BD93FC9|nr:hypothetical protein [Alteromonas oceanisediminis]MBT0585078.1 hypothetical protein [Alteromonas oceanisediminis]
MPESSLQNLLAAAQASLSRALSQSAETAQGQTARSAVSVTPVPVSVNIQNDRIRIADLTKNQSVSLPLPADATSSETLLKQASHASTTHKGDVALYSPPKTLFDALLSSAQQKALLWALAQQPNVLKSIAATPVPLTLRSGVVIATQLNSVTLELRPPLGDLKQVSVPVDTQRAPLASGQVVNLHVQQNGSQWIVKLLTAQPSDSSAAKPLQGKLDAQHPLPQQVVKQALASASLTVPVTQKSALLNALLTALPQAKANVLSTLSELPAVTPRLTLTQPENSTSALRASIVVQQPVSLLKSNQPVTQLDIPQLTAKQTAAVELATAPRLQQTLNTLFASLPDAPGATGRGTQEISSLLSSALQKSISPAAMSAAPAEHATDIKTQLQALIRTAYGQSGSSSESATALRQFMAVLAASPEPALQQLSSSLSTSLAPLLATKFPDAAQLQSLFQLPAMPLSTTALNQVSTTNSLLTGLVTLIQLSLSGRLSRAQHPISERAQQSLTSLLTSTGGNATAATPQASGNRPAQEFAQLEQRQQLLRTLSKALGQHQANKLSGNEATTQGQEAFFYSLPSYSTSSQRDIELLIKREKGHREPENNEQTKHGVWHLTMLFEVGDVGEMLSKCRLEDAELSLDIYTSNETLRDTVLNFMPLLKRRLAVFGLDVISSQCQLGKMPESLRPKPYQLLNTMA